MLTMLLYVVPIIVFLIVSLGMYMISNDKNKSKPKTIIVRNILPGIVVSLLVFVIIKYKDSEIFNPEPLMSGNYFE
jgi:RsiW-degrading membrane proteinase PrsW (M82 family)